MATPITSAGAAVRKGVKQATAATGTSRCPQVFGRFWKGGGGEEDKGSLAARLDVGRTITPGPRLEWARKDKGTERWMLARVLGALRTLERHCRVRRSGRCAPLPLHRPKTEGDSGRS